MMKTCLPFIHLSLQQINSCVAGKHGMVSTMNQVAGSEEGLETLCQQFSTTDKKNKASNSTSAHRTSTERDIGRCQLGEEDVSTNLQLAALQGDNDGLIDSNHLLEFKANTYNCNAGITETLAEGDTPSTPQTNVATMDHHKDKVFALAVAGDLLYSASQSKDIRVFRAPSFEEVDCFGSGNGMVQSMMAFGDKLYSAHQDNKIRVWRRVMRNTSAIRSGCIIKHKLVAALPRLDHFVKSMLLARNYVQVRRHKKTLWIQHVDTISALALGSSRSRTRGEGGDNYLRQRPPPTVLYSASWDKTVKVWSLSNFKCIESFYAHSDAINAMTVINGIMLATASADGSIKLWTKLSHNSSRRKKHSLINTLQGHNAGVNALAVSTNAKILYSGGSDGAIVAWKKVYSKPAGAGRLSRQISTLSSTLSEIKGMLQSKRSNARVSSEYSNEEILSLIGGLGEKGMMSEGRLSREGVDLGRTTSNACKQDGSGISSTSTAAECSSSGGKCEDVRRLRKLRSMSSGEMSSETDAYAGVYATKEHAAGSVGLGVNYIRRGGPVSNMNFVMRKVIVGHTRAVLSVSTVGDDIVCSSSADKTIRVWQLRVSSRPAGGRPDMMSTRFSHMSLKQQQHYEHLSAGGRNSALPRSHTSSSSSVIWDYECLAVLTGHGGPVKSIASICPNSLNHIPSRSVMIRRKPYTSDSTVHDQELHRSDDDSDGAQLCYRGLHESAVRRNGCMVIFSAGLDSKVKVWVLPMSS